MKSKQSRPPPQFRSSQPLISTPSPRKTWQGTMNTMFALFVGLTIIGGAGSSVTKVRLDMGFVNKSLVSVNRNLANRDVVSFVDRNLAATYLFVESLTQPRRDIKNEKLVYKTGSNLVPTYTVAADGHTPSGRKRVVLGADDERNGGYLSPMKPIAPEWPQEYTLPTTDDTEV